MKKIGRITERTVGAFEAKTNLSRYVADAQKGIVTIVSVRGRPAAKIVPADAEIQSRPLESEDLIRRARALRRRARKGAETLQELVNIGRR